MMKTAPLTLPLIEQGEFYDRVEATLASIQKAAIQHIADCGFRAHGSKTKMTISVELECLDPRTKQFRIKTKIKTSLPDPPDEVSRAVGSDTQDEQLALWVQVTGSHSGPAEQSVMADGDGRAIGHS